MYSALQSLQYLCLRSLDISVPHLEHRFIYLSLQGGLPSRKRLAIPVLKITPNAALSNTLRVTNSKMEVTESDTLRVKVVVPLITSSVMSEIKSCMILTKVIVLSTDSLRV